MSMAWDLDSIGRLVSKCDGMRAFFRRHILIAFFVMAFVLSWYPWIISLLRGRTSGPNPLGPFVAAIIMTAVVSGRSGLRQFFSRLVRWRVGAKPYTIVFLTPILVCLVALASRSVSRRRPPLCRSKNCAKCPNVFSLFSCSSGLAKNPVGAVSLCRSYRQDILP